MAPQLEFTPEELAAIRAVHFSGFTDEMFEVAIAECKRRNLIPGQHVVFQLRRSKEWDPEMRVEKSVQKLTRVTTIDAFRLVSERSGTYEGQGKARWTYLNEDGTFTMSVVPLPDKRDPRLPREPWSCAVPIYRRGFREPIEVEARMDAYAVTRRGKEGVVLTEMWQRRGPEMLAKCSEGAARRIAFPEEAGQMYLAEELAREDAEKTPEGTPTPVVPAEVPKAAVVPEVNHKPAVPTEGVRPGEPEKKPRAKTEVKASPKMEPEPEPEADEAPAKLETSVTVGGNPNPNTLATDDDLPDAMFPERDNVQKADTRLPTEEELKAIVARVRAFQQHVSPPENRAYYLRDEPYDGTKSIPFAVWQKKLAAQDAALAESKDALIQLVKGK